MHILIYINHKGSYIWRQNKHRLQEKQTIFKMENNAAKGTVIWSVWQFTTRYARLVPYSHVYLSFDGIQGGRRVTEAGMRWQVGRAGVSNKWLTSSTVLEPEILSRLYVSSSYYSTQNTLLCSKAIMHGDSEQVWSKKKKKNFNIIHIMSICDIARSFKRNRIKM